MQGPAATPSPSQTPERPAYQDTRGPTVSPHLAVACPGSSQQARAGAANRQHPPGGPACRGNAARDARLLEKGCGRGTRSRGKALGRHQRARQAQGLQGSRQCRPGSWGPTPHDPLFTNPASAGNGLQRPGTRHLLGLSWPMARPPLAQPASHPPGCMVPHSSPGSLLGSQAGKVREPLAHGQPREPRPRQADTSGGGSRVMCHVSPEWRGQSPERPLPPAPPEGCTLERWTLAAKCRGSGAPEAVASTRPQSEAGAGLPTLTLLRLREGGPGARTVFSPLLLQVRACPGAPRP